MKYTLILFSFIGAISMQAQTEKAMQLPYHQIPEYPEDYTAGNVVARMIDGLGYRYYWATEGLRDQDITFSPGDNQRSIYETSEHILGLTNMVLNATANKPNVRSADQAKKSFEEIRATTLTNLKKASDLCLYKSAQEVEEMKIIFQRGETKSEMEFWHILNGPLGDALWHTGQIVLIRRSAGNPINAGVSVFMGKTKE